MARPKGSPKLGGRKKGTKNKRTLEVEKNAAQGGVMPLDYALTVMRDEETEHGRRDDMAKAAMPYLHARRAPEDAKGKTVPPVVYITPSLED